MTKTRVTIAVLFIAAMAAGAALALAIRPAAAPPKPVDGDGRRGSSWMTRELDLTEAQREQMHAIWSEVGREGGWRAEGEQRRALQKERDAAIRELVPDELQEDLDKVYAAYAHALTELSAQRRRAFERAMEETKKLLTPEQLKKYEELLAKRNEGRGGPGRGRPWPPEGGPEGGSPPPLPRSEGSAEGAPKHE